MDIGRYVKRLLVDEDGFVAEQFLEEQVGAAVRVRSANPMLARSLARAIVLRL